MSTDEFSTEEPAASTPGPPPAFDLDGTAYTFLRLLEERGNGECVWLAERRVGDGLRGFVSIRRVRAPIDYERRQRLVEEVELASRLRHPAISQVYHLTLLGDDDPHVIMEYVDGPSLDTLISAAAAREEPLPEAFVLHVVSEVADALHHAHTLKDEEGQPLGVVHRDVSPRNVRVDRDTGAVKLTHFGAAYSLMVGREESPRTLLKGDVAYASPEYLEGTGLDARSDLFSLGLTLVELLTGWHLLESGEAALPGEELPARRPEEAPSLPLERMCLVMARLTPEDVARAVGGLPVALQELAGKLLRREPAERHASAAEVRDLLLGLLARRGSPYGRAEAAAEVARLLSQGTVLRGTVELAEGGVFPENLEAHELEPVTPPSRA